MKTTKAELLDTLKIIASSIEEWRKEDNRCYDCYGCCHACNELYDIEECIERIIKE